MANDHPARLGKYRIVSLLGEGAMGVVYKAHDPSIDREVAVKTIRKELTADAPLAVAQRERFRREAVAAGRLSHPGIVAVYDYGEEGDTAYIVMELAPGESLEEHLDRVGTPSLAETGAILTQLLDALGYAHARGVIHRDIKPANLLRSPSGRIKITDFGIARIQSSELTRSGVAVGTPSYMAPEQYAGGAVDHRADLFAVGVLLYELVTGERPFTAETLESLAYRIVHTPHRPPTQLRPGLPSRLDAILSTALAKNPEARYSSAAELSRGLALALAEAPAGGDAGAAMAATVLAGSSQVGVRTLPGFLGGETLREIEMALAQIVGPLSGALVRRSAARARDVSGFIDALGRSAGTPAEGARIAEVARSILARAEASSFAPSATPPPVTGAGSGTAFLAPESRASSSPSFTGVFTTAEIERVTAELTKLVGPIARVMVKKALPKSADLVTLCRSLAQGIEKEEDRARFLAAMKIG